MAQTSRLWGAHGEHWSPTSRLPDFSFAGYRRGEEPYRIPKETISVRDFGAKGDGRTDDTQAFHKALQSGAGKVISIPPGRYLLDDQFVIRTSSTVLRGAGSDQTILEFKRPLETIKPRSSRTDGGQPTSGWSWGGGFFEIGGRRTDSEPTVDVAASAKRGSNRLQLAIAAFQRGDEVVLTLRDNDSQSLIRHLFREEPKDDCSQLQRYRCQQVCRVIAVEGDTIVLDRGLRFDVRADWEPRVARFQPAVTDVGIEGLSFAFPAVRYPGHFKELGYNPAEIDESAAHCWLRDIHCDNADSGPYILGTFCTAEGIRLTADPERVDANGHTGHHGITVNGNDSLCTDFAVETRFIHDLTVQSSVGCVFSHGTAVDVSMDHHRWAPYENLYTDIDAGAGTRLFLSSGGKNRGPHTAAGATFWNIRAQAQSRWPGGLGVDAINVIAVPISNPPGPERPTAWFEPIPPGQVQPPNLYRAMLERRLASRNPGTEGQNGRPARSGR